ncbi:MAG: hypothetical protein E7334_02545 [Clostridiales bacterium]|nr:hypothetical protein [Clostridiales bacterium]
MTAQKLIKLRKTDMEELGFGTEAMKKIKVCKTCGCKCDAKAVKCDICSSPLPEKSLFDEYYESNHHCDDCRIVLNRFARFCPQCGKKL